LPYETGEKLRKISICGGRQTGDTFRKKEMNTSLHFLGARTCGSSLGNRSAFLLIGPTDRKVVFGSNLFEYDGRVANSGSDAGVSALPQRSNSSTQYFAATLVMNGYIRAYHAFFARQVRYSAVDRMFVILILSPVAE
jgi:hypothetical protein